MKHLTRAAASAVFSCLAAVVIAFSAHSNARPPGDTTPALPPPQSAESRETVTLSVTVTDEKGRYVDGLEKSYFTVLDKKLPLEITHFGAGNEPVSLGVVLDASAAMAGKGNMRRLRDELARFVEGSNGENEYFLMAFNERPRLLADWSRAGQTLLDRVESIEPKGSSALYDACYLGAEKAARGKHRKRALLLISDGRDEDSRRSSAELKKLLRETGVLLYSLILPGKGGLDSTIGLESWIFLSELSKATGGRAFFPNSSAELTELFGVIAQELRHQYQLGFRPADAARDGKWHPLKVKVEVPKGEARRGLSGLSVRAREGFFAAPRRR